MNFEYFLSSIFNKRINEIKNIFTDYLNMRIVQSNTSEKHVWGAVAEKHFLRIGMCPVVPAHMLTPVIVEECEKTESSDVRERMKRLAFLIFSTQNSVAVMDYSMGNRSMARFAVDFRGLTGNYIGRNIEFVMEESLKEKAFKKMVERI